jgi:hypothetical protein
MTRGANKWANRQLKLQCSYTHVEARSAKLTLWANNYALKDEFYRYEAVRGSGCTVAWAEQGFCEITEGNSERKL